MVLVRPMWAMVFKLKRLGLKLLGLRLRFVATVCLALLAVALGGAPAGAIAAPLRTAPTTTPIPLAVAGGSIFHFGGDRPSNLGPQNNHLQPCPESPNCVSSQSLDSVHAIEPIRFEGSGRLAMQALKQAIDDTERSDVIKADENYLYAEFTSQLMGFVDDVEFYFTEAEKTIEVRSAWENRTWASTASASKPCARDFGPWSSKSPRHDV
jgi:uncharacterized protein (DUF1499 family)